MPPRSTLLSRLIGEPLLHFALVGAAVFLLYGSRNADVPVRDASTIIEITPDLANQIAGQFKAVWSRAPTAQEHEGLIADYIREEVLYRDALALGLDRDDAVIRQRMRLKMELLSEGMAGSLNPDDATLAAWFEPRAQAFAAPPRITFLQLQLDPKDDAAAALAQLEAGSDPGQVGRGSLLPQRLEAAMPQTVDGNFGVGFYDALAAVPEGRWSGPVESAFGPHLVKILALSAPEQPALDQVRTAVLDAWRQEQVQVLRDTQFDALKARYRIVRSDHEAE